MSTRIHQNNVHEKSPQKRNSSGQKCPREFVKSVHENLPISSTRIGLLCPQEFFHPFHPSLLGFQIQKVFHLGHTILAKEDVQNWHGIYKKFNEFETLMSWPWPQYRPSQFNQILHFFKSKQSTEKKGLYLALYSNSYNYPFFNY